MHFEHAAATSWREWFRTPRILWAQFAKTNPRQGLIAYNGAETYQLYALDLPGGKLTQITDRPGGTLSGLLCPDGQYVYYLDDNHGNDLGHVVAVSLESGDLHDLTPDMPIYSWSGIGISQQCNLIAVALAQSNKYKVC